LEADWIVGYEKYLKQIRRLLVGKETYSTGMRGEVKRCRKAIELALEGKKVAVVSGGDPNIYGMAGLVLEILAHEYPYALEKINFSVIPGISALNVASALLGGALMHDFASISLSDRLTPWETIEKKTQVLCHGRYGNCPIQPQEQRKARAPKECLGDHKRV